MICLANPKARSGRGRKLQRWWQSQLARRRPQAKWHDCLSGEDCRQKAAQSAEPVVVAVGGDGTINNVVNGLMINKGRPSMGVLYSGTSPDFCKFHRIPLTKEAALAQLEAQTENQIDVAESAFLKNGEHKTAFFASSCNIGLGAATAAFANRWRKFLGDLPGTGLGLLIAMLRHRPFKSEITLDGRPLNFDQTNHILVLKNPHIASSLRLDMDCRADDGQLWLIVIHSRRCLGLLGLMRAMYKGDLLKQKDIFAQPGRLIEVKTAPGQDLEFDGDPQGQTPATIKIHPKALTLICGTENE